MFNQVPYSILKSYTFHINLYDLAFTGFIFVGLTFALLLWFTKSVNRSANRFLALALAIMITWMIRILAIDIRLETYLPRWDWLPMQYLLALGPLMYFYVLKITHPQYQFGWQDALHFSPLVLEQSALALEIKESAGTGIATYATHIFRQINPVLQLLIFISIITYLRVCNKLIQKFYHGLQPVLMDRPLVEFRWLRRLLASTAMLWLLWLVCAAVQYFGYPNQPGIQLYYPFYIFFVVIIIWTAAAALLKPQAVLVAQAATPPKPSAVPTELRAKGAWVKKEIEANLYYQDPELSLSTLAEKVGLHPNELSRIINTVFKKSFNDFINQYRVMEAARKMQDPANDNITLLSIGFEAGFNSKTTFNRIFKQMTGKSPTEYKNQLQNKRPSYSMGRHPRPELLILNREPLQKWVPEKLNSNFMFRNYLRIAWRNLIKNKAYSAINIIGLAVGMAVALLISLWVYDELNYNKGFANYSRIVRVMQTSTHGNETETFIYQPIPLAGELRTKYASDFKKVALSSLNEPNILAVGDKKLSKTGLFAQPDFAAIFSLNMVMGSLHCIDDPSSVAINKSLAITLFGDADPMGKVIKFNNKNSLKVSGVFEDFADNSEFKDVAFIGAWAYYQAAQNWVKNAESNWDNNSFQVYAQLQDYADIDKVGAKVKAILNGHNRSDKPTVLLHPMAKWHLYNEFKDGRNTGGSIQFVWMFGLIGFFVLLLACINFMNLSTARSEKRAKEVGIRKAVGSRRNQLVFQFLCESVLVTFLAFALALLLTQLALPAFNTLSNKSIAILWSNPLFWLAAVGFTLFTGIVSGSYPALYLSACNPVKVLKGTFKAGRFASLPRKILVVVQFSVSVSLIIGTAIVYNQVQYAKNRPIGYTRNGLISIDMNTPDLFGKYGVMRNELMNSGAAVNMAESSSPTTNVGSNGSGFEWRGKDPNFFPNFGVIAVTHDYGKTVGWQFTQGRDFSREFADSAAMVVNEAAVKYMGLKNPVGEVIKFNDRPNINFHIVGVIHDMVMESPYTPIKPTVFLMDYEWANVIIIKLNPNSSPHASLAKIETLFKKYNPGSPFEYHFVDDEYAKKFGTEDRISSLATFFAAFAVFISCLGLFGLASFTAEQRTREIGVRKVLGASVIQLWGMLSKEFVILVFISFFIAMPVAYYTMSKWLLNYPYRTSIPIWIFIATAAAALFITYTTVSFQAIKAALANPVKSLRTD